MCSRDPRSARFADVRNGAPGDAPSAYRRFFIIGSPRTGTTLVRLVLESHSQIACFDEWRSYMALATNDYDAPEDVRYLGFKIPAWTEQLADDHVIDPITNDPTVQQFYQGDPCIFMLRDVRDVVASMYKHEFDLIRPIIEKIRAKINQNQTFRQRFIDELAFIDSLPDPQLALGALYWKDKTLVIFDYVRAGLPMLGVRYEDLTAAPDQQLRRMVRFLDVPWEDGLLDHPSHPHGELSTDGLAAGLTDPKRSIDTSSIRSWEKSFSPDQLREIMTVAGDLNDRIHVAEQFDPELQRILSAHRVA
jgi:hypothetical protein